MKYINANGSNYHYYSIAKVNDKNVVLVNPHDTYPGKEIIMSRELFLKKSKSISGVKISDTYNFNIERFKNKTLRKSEVTKVREKIKKIGIEADLIRSKSGSFETICYYGNLSKQDKLSIIKNTSNDFTNISTNWFKIFLLHMDEDIDIQKALVDKLIHIVIQNYPLKNQQTFENYLCRIGDTFSSMSSEALDYFNQLIPEMENTLSLKYKLKKQNLSHDIRK